ncbi:hypothetical protein P2H44_11330 [Albimonas sp. CAU 1670]|uniref:hypothetical protein n=1 Tax=Albimonas sp. CAU 1670 TaxID=3032599 RepID=UPI0023DA4ACD|nr:hypothetical protein [Albimonas sp. CAU 1670]MDF2233143.1 hypothetical protein [Albimonas sp. CAU 1670]
MALLANVLLGLAGLLGLIGLVFIWMPPIGIPLLFVGGGLYVLSHWLKKETRRRAVGRQLGDR